MLNLCFWSLPTSRVYCEYIQCVQISERPTTLCTLACMYMQVNRAIVSPSNTTTSFGNAAPSSTLRNPNDSQSYLVSQEHHHKLLRTNTSNPGVSAQGMTVTKPLSVWPGQGVSHV